MIRTRVKICCIASTDEAQMAIAAGADAVGLVAAMPSGPGVIADNQISIITRIIPPPVSSFLLTAETTADAIVNHVAQTGPSTVLIVNHIAATESAALAQRLTTTRIVQVVHVEDASALALIDTYAPYVHAFLLDSGRPSLTTPELGGTGRTHDWSISAEFVQNSPKPVFLAGGLRPDNVADAVRQVRPYGLDLCSGVRRDGKLHAATLTAFMHAVREANQEHRK